MIKISNFHCCLFNRKCLIFYRSFGEPAIWSLSLIAHDNCCGQEQARNDQNTQNYPCNEAAICGLHSCKVFALTIDTDRRQIPLQILCLLNLAKFSFAADISFIPASANHMITDLKLAIGRFILIALNGDRICKFLMLFIQLRRRAFFLWWRGN